MVFSSLYVNTFQNCVHIDNKTKKVKIARIYSFDESNFFNKDKPPAGTELVNSGYKKNTEKYWVYLVFGQGNLLSIKNSIIDTAGSPEQVSSI